ncbi:hypothetical protein LOKVESSMR4R_02804 [Yoonia vestfoldensis]|jgi:hypothetical protein|uniref:Transmembrane protein n=1 Tax=Yoonia vestfoldensis TaxID=245188 RepID=A0A1Y0EF70_9RHOB|nr:hypothetical protein LOKVESSMR4R_02804 [Yoonia vestfoldensis]
MIQPRSCRDAAKGRLQDINPFALFPIADLRGQVIRQKADTIVRYLYYMCFGCIAAFLGATQAQAMACADTALVAQRLAQIYGERQLLVTPGPDGSLTQLFAATDTGSWTIAITQPDGQTCLVASGAGFDWRAALFGPGRST